MLFDKKANALSKGVAMGVLATSIMPTMSINENMEASAAETNKIVEVTASAVNIRSGASTKYSIVATVKRGTKLQYLSKCSNGWYKIKYKGSTRYITNKYTKLTGKSTSKDSIKKVGKVKTTTLNVRSGPSTKYSVKKKIKKNSVVGIISSSKDWTKVKLSSSLTGYVSTDYIKIYSGDSGDIKVSYASTSSSSSTSNSKVNKVVSAVKAQVGKPYVYGAAGPNSFDCSGLTYYCYKKAGVYLNRSSRDQASNGKYVSKSNLKAGDLIFFNSGTKSIRHVGMYVGNGKFIHSPSPGKKVKYESLSSSYYTKGYVTARRIIY